MKLFRKHSTSSKTQNSVLFNSGGSPFFSGIQPKLTVSKADDPQEREADQVADRVMQNNSSEALQRQPMEEEEEMMQPKLQRQEEEEEAQPKLQREEEEEEATQLKLQTKGEEEEEAMQMKTEGATPTVSPKFSKSLQASKSGGVPLPKTTNVFMSRAMGADFSKVRIHTDANAVNMNRQIRAKAFTHGKHLYFNLGQYDPGSRSGKWLLAHELTHTIQQKAVRPKRSQ